MLIHPGVYNEPLALDHPALSGTTWAGAVTGMAPPADKHPGPICTHRDSLGFRVVLPE